MVISDKTPDFRAYAAGQYALHIRSLRHGIDALQYDIDDMRDSLTGVRGVAYSDMPGNPNAYGDAIPDGVARLQDMVAEYCTRLSEWMDERMEAHRAFARLEKRHYALLTLYYADGLSWDQVAERMGYSVVYVRGELKNEALVALYSTMPETWRRGMPKAI